MRRGVLTVLSISKYMQYSISLVGERMCYLGFVIHAYHPCQHISAVWNLLQNEGLFSQKFVAQRLPSTHFNLGSHVFCPNQLNSMQINKKWHPTQLFYKKDKDCSKFWAIPWLAGGPLDSEFLLKSSTTTTLSSMFCWLAFANLLIFPLSLSSVAKQAARPRNSSPTWPSNPEQEQESEISQTGNSSSGESGSVVAHEVLQSDLKVNSKQAPWCLYLTQVLSIVIVLNWFAFPITH